jgi:hypothetical protein
MSRQTTEYTTLRILTCNQKTATTTSPKAKQAPAPSLLTQRRNGGRVALLGQTRAHRTYPMRGALLCHQHENDPLPKHSRRSNTPTTPHRHSSQAHAHQQLARAPAQSHPSLYLTPPQQTSHRARLTHWHPASQALALANQTSPSNGPILQSHRGLTQRRCTLPMMTVGVWQRQITSLPRVVRLHEMEAFRRLGMVQNQSSTTSLSMHSPALRKPPLGKPRPSLTLMVAPCRSAVDRYKANLFSL